MRGSEVRVSKIVRRMEIIKIDEKGSRDIHLFYIVTLPFIIIFLVICCSKYRLFPPSKPLTVLQVGSVNPVL